jgi:hypothetical protein
LTFDQSSPKTKVVPAFTNVPKGHEFCENFLNATHLSCRGLQDQILQLKKIVFDSEMENPHH